MELTVENPLGCVFLTGLWGEADDKGAFEWKPLTLKARILPAPNVDPAALLAILVKLNLIAMYEVDGAKYGAIRKFGLFQRPRKPNDLYPMPLEFRKYASTDGSSTELELVESDTSTEPDNVERELFPQKSENSKQMKDVIVKEEDSFDRWWTAYPKKVGKIESRKQYLAAVKKAEPADLLAAMQRYVAATDSQYLLDPERWLKRERWLDEPQKPQHNGQKSNMVVY